eukprot:GHVU01075388.1.p2 GENE.GHVU01075388.1~~GHVU01075388.1.p2  ORF type:complete len:140 (-),score=2.07 GHVU01075388.1:267-686(-)
MESGSTKSFLWNLKKGKNHPSPGLRLQRLVLCVVTKRVNDAPRGSLTGIEKIWRFCDASEKCDVSLLIRLHMMLGSGYGPVLGLYVQDSGKIGAKGSSPQLPSYCLCRQSLQLGKIFVVDWIAVDGVMEMIELLSLCHS